jgi:hypothetical protein
LDEWKNQDRHDQPKQGFEKFAHYPDTLCGFLTFRQWLLHRRECRYCLFFNRLQSIQKSLGHHPGARINCKNGPGRVIISAFGSTPMLPMVPMLFPLIGKI